MRTVFRHYRYEDEGDILVHYRRSKDDDGKPLCRWEPSPRGGMTICFQVASDNALVYAGVALCSPRDNFSYRVGRRIAQGRAEAGVAMRWPSWAEKPSLLCSEFIVSLLHSEERRRP